MFHVGCGFQMARFNKIANVSATILATALDPRLEPLADAFPRERS